MARPKKPGLSYFPKDTNFFSDRKVRRIIHEFGAKGVLIYDYLLCVAYSDKGYYVPYDDQLAFDIADSLQCGITEELTLEVINGCIRVGLFNKDLYDRRQILTSKGIQERYLSAKKSGVIPDETSVLTPKTIVNDAETPINPEESTQSKVKERIEKVKKEFFESCKEYLSKYPKDMIRDFYDYWTEHGESDKKMRFEKQTSFGLSRRLATWHKNSAKFDKPITEQPAKTYKTVDELMAEDEKRRAHGD
jgi:hypothetical protein